MASNKVSQDLPRSTDRFNPEEETDLLHESNTAKAAANTLFASTRYSEAIGTYDRALALCPDYLDYETALLRSNISACHLKLQEWKEAVEAATKGIEALERMMGEGRIKEGKGEREKNDSGGNGNEVVEIEGEGDEEERRELRRLELSDQRRQDVQRIRVKVLMRRARGRSELGGWGNLQGAEEDYTALAKMNELSPQDRKLVQKEVGALPRRIEEAKQKEMGDMMGKLKELGNGILKPFGLSTDNFNMVKDEATGGYSMNFNQGR